MSTARPRSLLPREHGAYFQLAIPLVAAWCARTPTLASGALGGAAIAGFLAYEPIAIVTGGRGPRVREAEGRRARARSLLLVGIAAALAVLGFATAPSARLAPMLALAAPIALAGGGVVALAARRAEHALAGELLAAVALTGASAIVQLASGAALADALVAWTGWIVGFGAAVLAVQRVLARRRDRRATALDRVALAVAALAIPTASALAVATPLRGQALGAIVVAVALVTTAAIVIARPPPATRLRAVGIAVACVAAIAATAAALLA